jgi:Domain of unknown function (DUF3786)/Putative Fe-S cluster
MAYKVIDIYKDLPKTNCNECGKPGCFAFATSVFLESTPLSACPYLEPETLAVMEMQLGAERGETAGEPKEKGEQALGFLLGEIEKRSLIELAESCGATYSEGPPEALTLDFLARPYQLTGKNITVLDEGEEPTVWVKILLYIYATRASGGSASGMWVAFRELPNTASKAKSFEECCDKLAASFSGKLDELDRACESIGAKPETHESADRAYTIRALPKVSMQLLFWDEDEDFPARSALLLDSGVLDYLDHEAIVFSTEALVNRLLGESYEELVP